MSTPPSDPQDPGAPPPAEPVRKRPMIRVHGGDLAKVAPRVPSWLRSTHLAAPRPPVTEAPAEPTEDLTKKVAG